MKIEFDLEIADDSSMPRVEVAIMCGDRRRVIYVDYPNPDHMHGIESAAFGLVAQRFEEALQELSLERR